VNSATPLRRDSAYAYAPIGGTGWRTVAGTLHLRLKAALDQGGGYQGAGAQGATLSVTASAFTAQVIGSYNHNRSYSSGAGSLAGLTDSPVIDFPFTITGSFPVGSPFVVRLELRAGGGTCANSGVSPAFFQSDVGGRSDDRSGSGAALSRRCSTAGRRPAATRSDGMVATPPASL
jgi:hypothetical protein